jgi:hypothetical protein
MTARQHLYGNVRKKLDETEFAASENPEFAATSRIRLAFGDGPH